MPSLPSAARVLLAAAVLALSATAVPAASTAASASASASAPAPATRSGTHARPVRSLAGIQEYRLPNGLQVLLFPDEAQSTTTVNVTYRVGSRHESQGEYGMAHLLEHLQFRGTPAHPSLKDEFTQRGARWNGSTTEDRTNYFESFNADPATLDWALAMEADRMTHSFIRRSDLDKEMTVVRNEFEIGENDPARVLLQRVKAAAYAWHPYGHATIGARSDIEQVPIANLQAFYRRFYRPDNATLLVAGRFDPVRTLARIERHFGRVPRPAAPVPAPWTAEPAQDGERSVVVRRVGGQPLVIAFWHVPAAAHPDTAALVVYELLLSIQPSGRLYRDLVEPRVALSASLDGTGGHDPGGAMAVLSLPPGADVDRAQQRLLDLVEGRTPVAFDEAELARVKALARNAYRDQMKSPEGLIQGLSEVLGQGDWRLAFQLLEDIDRVTLADVERVRAAYFRAANRTVGRYLPADAAERVEIPAAPPLGERLAALRPPEVEAGEQFVPTPEALAARTRTRTLPSGIRLAMLPKRTRGNEASVVIDLQWGDAPTTTPRRGTDLAGALLSEGTTTRTKQQLLDEMIRLKAEISVSGGNQGATLYVRAERDTLLEALALAADMVRHPAYAPEPFERLKAAQLAQIEASRHTLSTLVADAAREHFNAARHARFGEPDYQASLDEIAAETRATTLQDVVSFHREYWSANLAQVAAVGALPEGLEAAVERLFGDWRKPQAPAFVRWTPRHADVAPARFDVAAPDKTSAQFEMSQPIALNEADPDHAALVVALHVLGGGPGSRLAARVREREGLSYGTGAALHASHWGDDASVVIGGSFAPANRDRILAAVREEVAAFGRDGATAAEVARAVHDLLEQRQQGRTDDGSLAGAMAFHLEAGLDWRREARRDAALAAVTPEQVLAAWRRHVRPDGFVVVTAGDFRAAPGAAGPAPRGAASAPVAVPASRSP